jgi:hypothetical protein
MRRLAAAAATAAALLTGCGHPLVPVSLGLPAASTPGPDVISARAITTGVDLYVDRDYTLAQTVGLGERDIAWIARTLRVGAIGLAWDLTVPDGTSGVVRASGPVTASVADIRALTEIAQAYHLRVEYRILFRVGGSDGRTESLRPASQSRFFASLLSAETPYLKLAAQQNVGEFIVGTELASLEGSPEWSQFFSDAGTVYPGILSYATWGGSFFSAHPRLPPVAGYGVTAYPSVDLPDNASVARLTAAWTSFLGTVPASVLQRTAIDEVGIPAEAGAYADPWAWNNQHGAEDDQVQARWFEAVCDAAAAAHMRAIYFWNANLIDNPEDPFPSLVKFEGRPASEAAIRNCGSEPEQPWLPALTPWLRTVSSHGTGRSAAFASDCAPHWCRPPLWPGPDTTPLGQPAPLAGRPVTPRAVWTPTLRSLFNFDRTVCGACARSSRTATATWQCYA